MSTDHDYDLSKKVKIAFKGMDYNVMPRYKDHYLNHEYERFSLQILKNNLKAGSLFVDVGAHYGAYSLYAANETGCDVIAVEPVSENFTLLSENISINKLDKKIVAHEYAASDENGEAEFNIPWASDSAGFYQHPNAHSIRTQKVQVRMVDDLIGKKPVKIIKIDTEGHEIGVLKGLKKTLAANPGVQLIIELNPPLLENAGTDSMALLELVKSYGKEIYMVDEDKFTMYRITDCLDKWPQFINAGNYANLYCVPAQGHQYAMFVSHSAGLGGAELAMCEQADQLRNFDIFSHIILPSKGPLESVLIEKGIGYTIVDDYSFWVSIKELSQTPELIKERNLKNIEAATEISDLIKDINPTLIVNNTIVNPWGYPGARVNDLPLVWMVHEFGDKDHGLPLVHGIEATRSFIVEMSDAVVACSDAVKRSLPSHAGNVSTVYNLLQLDEVVNQSKEKVVSPFSDDKAFKLCTVGTVSEGKGQDYIVDAIDSLKKDGMHVELMIIGAPASKKYQTQLKKKIKTLGLESSITFLGFINNPYPYIKQADAVVVASRNEAFGRITAEAMAIGVPVIASNSGGSLEMILDKKSGFLFEASNPQSLAKVITQVSNLSPKEVEAVTVLAKRNIANLLDIKSNTTKLAKLFNATVERQSNAERKKAMVVEWAEAFSAIHEKTDKMTIERDEFRNRAEVQERNNVELLEAINALRGSRSYRLATKIAGVKRRVARVKGK